MNPFLHLALRSLKHYAKANFTLALGVAAATAVFTGALIVGDSMRGSLRQLTLERLGRIDEMLVSEGFFSESLASDLTQLAAFKGHYDQAEPIVLFPGGTAEFSDSAGKIRRAGQITLIGIRDGFWEFDSVKQKNPEPLTGNSISINRALAEYLQISDADVAAGAKLTVRLPKQNQLPGDSPMSKQDDLVESLVNLQIVKIIPTTGLGRFSLYPSQADPLNIFLPADLLQSTLEQTVLKHKSNARQANVILLAGRNGNIPNADASRSLLNEIQPSLEDLGLSLRRVTRVYEPSGGSTTLDNTIFDYYSLTTDRMVFRDAATGLINAALGKPKPVFTYLANDIRLAAEPATDTPLPKDKGIPFSMIAAIDFDKSFQPRSIENGEPIPALQSNEIVLTEWAASDLKAKVGDTIQVRFFEPETTHGRQVEQLVEFKLTAIAKLTEPTEGYIVPRRGPIVPSKFAEIPEVTNDPDLTPEVPGVTDAESIDRWDLPFETADKIRTQDDQFWDNHRTTPKAYVSLTTGQRLWKSRFGQVTGYRLLPGEKTEFRGSDPASEKPGMEKLEIENRLRNAAKTDLAPFGLQLQPIKRRGLEASSGSTPFDFLFLALSMFVIGSALVLVVLLFRLNFQQRSSEVGLLSAIGFSQKQTRSVWLIEMLLVSGLGAIAGVGLGVGYASLMIWGLSTWWVGAIARPFLETYIQPQTLLLGMASGILISLGTIVWALRSALKQTTRSLLAGHIERAPQFDSPGRSMKGWSLLPIGFLFAAIGLTWLATQLSGEGQAGAFLGAGFMALVFGLMMASRFFRKVHRSGIETLNLRQLAILNSRRNPVRSTLTVGLVAVASFLIASVSAFRLAPAVQGTGGFDLIAKSSQPILADLSTTEGLVKIVGDAADWTRDVNIVPLRYKSGEDASCNNLYQSKQPQVIGLPTLFIEQFDARGAEQIKSFGWGGSLADEATRSNPWRLLVDQKTNLGTAEDPIPTVIDKNTANYSLKIYSLNTVFTVRYDDGQTICFRVVGFLSNTILQGSLLIGEEDFVSAFPGVGGYQQFLIREEEQRAENAQSAGRVATDSALEPIKSDSILRLEDQLSDYGFEARSTTETLANFMRVQNTYLSTFQTLGSLGLLLGTFGLAVVQLRSVLERQRELGLLRAVGFQYSQLRKLVLFENWLLLILGLGIGLGGALLTTLPHALIGNAAPPWIELGLMFLGIVVIGIMTSYFASGRILKLPILESLRS